MKKEEALYLKALRAVASGHRSSTGQRRVPASQRSDALYNAKQVAKDPVFGALVEKRKLKMPSKEEMVKTAYRHNLREGVKFYRFSSHTRKVAPEHRQSVTDQAKRMSALQTKPANKYAQGTQGMVGIPAHMPRKLIATVEAAETQRRNVSLALVRGTWYTVDHVIGRKDDGDPYFFGTGRGYDIGRYVAFASGESDAAELAENTYPKEFFTNIITMKQFQKLEEKGEDGWEENPENYHFIQSLGKMGLPEEDIRIFAPAEEFVRTAKTVGLRLYRLTDGRVVEGA